MMTRKNQKAVWVDSKAMNSRDIEGLAQTLGVKLDDERLDRFVPWFSEACERLQVCRVSRVESSPDERKKAAGVLLSSLKKALSKTDELGLDAEILNYYVAISMGASNPAEFDIHKMLEHMIEGAEKYSAQLTAKKGRPENREYLFALAALADGYADTFPERRLYHKNCPFSDLCRYFLEHYAGWFGTVLPTDGSGGKSDPSRVIANMLKAREHK